MFNLSKSVVSQSKTQLRPLSLRANFSWTFVGNVVYAGCQWGMLVVLAKLGSPEMVGRFALGLAIATPVIMFTSLQLRTAQATDARHEYVFGDYLALRLVMTSLALLVIAGITFVSGYCWETTAVVLIVGLAKAFESISDVIYGLLQQRERMDRIAKSMMIKGPLSLLALGVGIYLTANVIWGVVGLAIAWATVLVGYDISSGVFILKQPQKALAGETSLAETLRPRWEIRTLAKLVGLTLPLGLVRMLIALNTNIPRYFIERHMGERALGIFAAMAYFMVAGLTVENALGESASPRLAKYYAEGDIRKFRLLIARLLGVFVLLGAAGVFLSLIAGSQILTLFYQPEYAAYTEVFVWLMVAAAIRYLASLLNYAMAAARHFKIQIPMFVIVTGTTALAAFWLIPTRGLMGATMALIISAIVQASIGMVIVLYALRRIGGQGDITRIPDV